MIGMVVTSTGLLLSNAELLWIRAHAPQQAAKVVLGTRLDAIQQSPDLWLAFCQSYCFQWDADAYGCLNSELHVSLVVGVEYDLVAWAEAGDRRAPDREMTVLAQRWRFHPGDANLDGGVDCGDWDFYLAHVYDWNQDGEITIDDLDQVSWTISGFLADLNQDGVINGTDVVLLFNHWGPCPSPPDPCPADLNCDGVVDSTDLVRLVSLFGG